MSEMRITIRAGTPEEVTLGFTQAMKLAECLRDFPEPVWHFNECGCCVSVHDKNDGTCGWIVNSDGEASWAEAGGNSAA